MADGGTAAATAAPEADPAADSETTTAAVPVMESVVTASRGRPVGTAPVASSLLTPREVALSPSRAPDDVLRSMASVSLPRGSSQAQHPTAQSISLRGLGRGRTLVLVDGVPVNDPFGGWIQWNRVPRSEISRVEVVRGATSNLYGSLAMGGVVQLFTRPPNHESATLEADFGTADAAHGAVHFSRPITESLSVSASVDALRSSGEHGVSQAFRGAVDQPSPYESQNAGGRLHWALGEGASAWMTAHYFREERNGGTPLTDNRQWIADVGGGLSLETGNGRWEAAVFGGLQRFHNVNSRIDAARGTENLALRQQIPVASAGGSLLWSRSFGSLHQVAVGTDLRWVDATNEEAVFGSTGAPLGTRLAGGRQALGGVFAEWEVRPLDALTLTAGLRAEGWSNHAGRSVSIAGEETALAEKWDGALAPRLTAIYRLMPQLAARLAAYGGFRAPNLNELYRGFIAGGIQVIPNPALGAERLYGAEAGADWSPGHGLTLATTAFVNLSRDQIEQVTLDSTTRQRRNLAGARAVGAEVEAAWRPLRALRLAAGYTFTHSAITDFPEAPDLVGNRLPNAPLHIAVASVHWQHPDWFDALVRVRAEGSSYADDRNTFLLPAFTSVDATVSRRLRDEVELFASVTNLLDAEVITDRTATLERIGSPRALWGGFRVRY